VIWLLTRCFKLYFFTFIRIRAYKSVCVCYKNGVEQNITCGISPTDLSSATLNTQHGGGVAAWAADHGLCSSWLQQTRKTVNTSNTWQWTATSATCWSWVGLRPYSRISLGTDSGFLDALRVGLLWAREHGNVGYVQACLLLNTILSLLQADETQKGRGKQRWREAVGERNNTRDNRASQPPVSA